MKSIDEIVRSIDARLHQLRGEIGTLTQAREELTSNPATARAAAPRRTPRVRRSGESGTRALSGGASLDDLHRVLAGDGDGLSTAELAERADSDPAAVLPRLRELEAAGRVRRTGQRRGTRWHAVASEEEWIAKRAAELAGHSRSA